MGRVAATPLVLALLATAGCGEGAYDLLVRFEPESLGDEVVRVQVAVVDSCGAQSDSGGAPQGVVQQVEVRRGRAADEIGDLDPGRYGLYGRGWSGDCAVVAAGCVDIEAEEDGEGTLVLPLSPVDGPACADGEVCVADRCVPEGTTECDSAADCDDGLFCNGEETCDPGDPAADALGCVAAASGPCADGERCQEQQDRCQ